MNNKVKTAVAVALISSGIAIAAPASAEQYVSAQVAISEIGNNYLGSSFDNGLSAVVTYGIGIPAVHKYFGVEGELSKSIVDPEYNSWGNHAEYDYYTGGAYAVFTIPVHEKINIRARGGLVYNHWKVTGDTVCVTWWTCGESSGSDINPSIGGGATYTFNDNINLMAELTAFDVDEGSFHLSAGAQFKF
jgi:hypothetical protein